MLESQQKGIRTLETLRSQGYEYKLEKYTSHLSELTIRAYKSDSPGFYFYITFQTVVYIQMPTHWNQGDFCLATQDEHERIARDIGLNEHQAQQLLLLTVQPSVAPEIFVLCHKVFLSQEVPIT
jgi:hypothetical protein